MMRLYIYLHMYSKGKAVGYFFFFFLFGCCAAYVSRRKEGMDGRRGR